MIGTLQWLSVVSMAVLDIGTTDALAFSVLIQLAAFVPVTFASPFIAWWLVIRRRRPAAGSLPQHRYEEPDVRAG